MQLCDYNADLTTESIGDKLYQKNSLMNHYQSNYYLSSHQVSQLLDLSSL